MRQFTAGLGVMVVGLRRCAGLLGLLLVLSVTALSWAEEPKIGESVNGLQAFLAIHNPLVRQPEDVLLEVALRNVSGGPLVLVDSAMLPGRRNETEVEFMVRRADSAQSGFFDLLSDDLVACGIGGSSYKRLDPGTSLKSSLRTGLNVIDFGHTDGIAHLQPGRYEVSVLVCFRPDGNKDAWVGSVRSNWVAFEVVRTE